MIWYALCTLGGAALGVFALAIVQANRDTPPVRRFDGNKVIIIGTNAQGGIVTERHFDTPTAMAEALIAAEFLLLNEGVRDDGLRVDRRRVGAMYVESVR